MSTHRSDDELRLAAAAAVDEARARAAIERVTDAVRDRPSHAALEGVPPDEIDRIAAVHRSSAA